MNKKSPVASFSLHRKLNSFISLVWCDEPLPQLVAYVGKLLLIYLFIFLFLFLFLFFKKMLTLGLKTTGGFGHFSSWSSGGIAWLILNS